MHHLIGTSRLGILFLALCVCAAVRPLLIHSDAIRATVPATGFPGWSMAPIPAGLTTLRLSPHESKFAEQFPGEIGAFSDGQSTWIVRWISRPSRKLHPAADCLRATGYAVASEPIFAGNDGTNWGVSTAQRERENLMVRERIVDAAGREFTDVSAWFWAAVLEKSVGPWWSVTRIESASSR